MVMKRTTILVDEGLLVEARQLAAQQGMTFTAVVQEALRAYIAAHRPQRHISFIGMGCSGQPPVDLRDGRDEEILAAEIDPIYGWAPHLENAKQATETAHGDGEGAGGRSR